MRYRGRSATSPPPLSFRRRRRVGFLFREPEKAKRSLGDLEERRFGPRVAWTGF